MLENISVILFSENSSVFVYSDASDSQLLSDSVAMGTKNNINIILVIRHG